MICPYCDKVMVAGTMYGDDYKMKWMPASKKLILGIWAMGAKKVGKGGLIGRANLPAHFCASCKKIIVDEQ